jgi:hypothetical protein
MIEKLCLPVKCDYGERYVCNEAYMNHLRKTKYKDVPGGVRFEVLTNKLVQCMEDLIKYCLTYNIEIDVPEQYKVTKIYNIILTTGNFDPDNRECSNCHSSIIYSSLDEDYIHKKFEYMCKCVNRKNIRDNFKNYFCWHTEDFADNQIIHSYNIDESYIVERVGE